MKRLLAEHGNPNRVEINPWDIKIDDIWKMNVRYLGMVEIVKNIHLTLFQEYKVSGFELHDNRY